MKYISSALDFISLLVTNNEEILQKLGDSFIDIGENLIMDEINQNESSDKLIINLNKFQDNEKTLEENLLPQVLMLEIFIFLLLFVGKFNNTYY